MEQDQLRSIAELFGARPLGQIRELTKGHINRTFLLRCEEGEAVLQSLSPIFPSPENVMHNIAQVTRAFGETPDCGICVPGYLPCGERNFAELDGLVWRMYPYAGGSGELSPYRTGCAFGEFIRILSSRRLKLKEALPGYHSFEGYFSRFTAVSSASASRKPDSAVTAQLGRLGETLSQVFTGKLPKRVIHGDAKSANLVAGDCPTVIDLDTVMTGYAAIDYGDMARSAMRESAPDMAVLRDLTRGFAGGTRGLLTGEEVGSLYYGILWAVGELAVRYLTDYISGEGYFRQSAGECLARADALLGQLRGFLSAGGEIMEMIEESFFGG
ncbi:MAG: aminoglycoside phosphotransferase family protein [Ruminococcus sp.]|nr:aminoglycoside phosphotransferase family protein [Ruminococcus sp.]